MIRRAVYIIVCLFSFSIHGAHQYDPLCEAIEKRDLDEVKLLCESGCDVNKKDDAGKTPLHKAVVTAHLEIIECLLQHGALASEQDNEGDTPLHDAAWSDLPSEILALNQPYSIEFIQRHHREVVKLLLCFGADRDMKNQQKKLPRDLAQKRLRNDFARFIDEYIPFGHQTKSANKR